MHWKLTRNRLYVLASIVTFVVTAAVIIALVAPLSARAASPTDIATHPYGIDQSKLQGKITLAIQLKGVPLALTPGQDRSQDLKNEQDAIMAKLATYNVREVARLAKVLNAVIVEVDSAKLRQLATVSGISQLSVVTDTQIDDPNTNALVGATTVQNAGLKGDGRVVAVLDSGADFTHASLSGPGTIADYTTCYAQNAVAPTGTCANYFGPTAPKVIGGYDFVGETWPNTALAPDPNPIDKEGHGTHVADIIAGTTGVAPNAKVVAVRVCSAVATSCSGTAILQGLDYVASWNLDAANAARKIDVVNMSLGASYGQQQNADVAATENLVQTGVSVVISAGNSSNKPYIVGSPSTAPSAISVAQTEVASSKLYPISLTINGTTTVVKYSVLQNFGPALTSTISGPVQYGVGADKKACAALPAGSFAGKVAFIDRGTCSISAKVANAGAAGALAVIIGLVAPGDPFTFSYGGGTVTVPSFAINQASGNLIRTATGPVTAVIDPANAIPLVESVVGSSSRGPSISDQSIKPEIGAPGASLSAEVGTGNGNTVFGGTSGAAPVVSGTVLLVKQQYPDFTPLEVKSLLMNTAATGINSLNSNGDLNPAPITRIGSGEVRIDRAIASQTLVTVVNSTSAALSFGYYNLGLNPKILTKTIRIKNMSSQGRLYVITNSFRDPAQANTGAVQFQSGFPRNAWVSANATTDVVIQMMITGPQLKPWTLNASVSGGDATALDAFEYDGYIKVDGGNDQNRATLPWQVLPHKAADTQVVSTYNGYVNGATTKVIQFANSIGAYPGQVETFQLLGTRPSSGAQPGIGANFALIDLKAFGVRDTGSSLQFALSTYEQQPTPNYPAEYDVYIDTTGGSSPNYVLFNGECGLSFGNDGRNCAYLVNIATGTQSVVGFTDASYNSGNLIMSVPLSALGLTSGKKISTFVAAADNYFTGNITSLLPANGTFATYTIGQPRFALQALPWAPFPSGSNGTTFTIGNNGFQVATSVGASSLSTADGLLFVYRNALNLTREVETVTLP